MKLAVFCFVFYVFIQIERTAAHPACFYESLRLKLTADAGGCREACATFEFPGKGKCFAYVFDPEDETCEGYLLDHSDAYTSFEKCGVNTGIGINFPSDDEDVYFYSTPDADDDDSGFASSFDAYYSAYHGVLEPSGSDGCTLTLTSIGAAASEKKCKKLCKEVEDGDLYGGCLAWFWNPNSDSCSGLLAKYDEDNEKTCASL